MVHPIFTVLVTKPHLVMEHVSGYAALVREEASSVGIALAKRAIAWGVALVASLVFLILLGVAIMLGAVQGFHWALVVVPAVVLVIAIAGVALGLRPLPEKGFQELKAQLDADAQALRAIGARS
jgi:ABC-type polysaccharide/polyol phosphate export permease